MSAQIAMMAGAAALSSAGSIGAAGARARGLGQQAAMADLQGEQAMTQRSEVEVETAQNEYQRRQAILHLMSINAADLSGRGVSGGQGTSADVIEDYNRGQAERDIANVRFMGEARSRRLSFQAGSSFMESQSLYGAVGPTITSGWLAAGATLLGAAYRYGADYGGGGGGGGGEVKAVPGYYTQAQGRAMAVGVT